MFSALKKIFTDPNNETNNNAADGASSSDTPEGTDDENNEDTSNTSAAKTIVCQGGKCSCNQSETPTQIPLKVTTQSKFYINDENGSDKLIASTMELGQPFDAPFFGKCKLQPSGSSFLPCQPAITQWQKPYENVELANGGKILTEDSTAMCAIGGMIKIEDHGQDPVQVNEAQIQNGTLAVTTLLNPMITEADLEILAGGGFDGDTTDDTGASVKKITTIDSKTKYIKDQWISFKVSKWYNENAADKDKVNWVVYDDAGETLHTYQDKGELLDVRFSEDGTYKVEAYGGSAGGTKAATYTVTIKKPELNSVDKNVAAKIRPGEQATFTLAVDMPEVLDVATVEDVQWAVYKSTNKGRTYTETVENAVAGNTYKETVTFAEKGYYKIKATREEKTVETTLRVGLNGVTMIQLDKTSMRTHNDTIKLKVPDNAYSIKPPTAEEKQAIKWVVYDSAFNEVTALSGTTGETFEFSDHTTEGDYYVEAYMNTSEIGRIKKGKTSSCIKKVTVTTPSVKRMEWTDSKGRYKTTCGFDEEVYVKLKLEAFNDQKIKLKFYNIQKDSSKTTIAETRAIKVDNKGEVHYKIKFDKNTYKEKLTNGSQKGAGYVVYEVLPDDDKEVIKHAKAGMSHFEHGMKINVKSKAAISGIFFEKSDKRVRNVLFDDTISCHIKSYNLIGKTVTIHLYRYDKALWADFLNPDDTVNSYTATIDSEGKASFDICIEKKWNGWVGTRETFYIEVDDVPWYSKAIRTQGVIVGFTKKDKLQNQVNPVVVEQSTFKKKNTKCIRCETDLITLDLEKVLDAHGGDLPLSNKYGKRVFDYLPDLNKYMKEFGINDNCRRRGHFLGQVAKETGFWSYNEDFVYNASKLKSTFGNFKTTEGKQKADDWGKTSSKNADEVEIANWAYAKGSKATELGNEQVTDDDWGNENHDGYKYRGRGLVQLTGKSNYKAFQKWYDKKKNKYSWPNYNFETNPEKVTEHSLIVALSAIYFWDKNNMNLKADMGEKETDVLRISNIINSGESDAKKLVRYENFVAALNQVRENSDCTIINYTPPEDAGYYVFKDGTIKYIAGGKEINYYVETEEGNNTFKKVATLTKNGYGMVKFPETGDGFGSYSNGDIGGIDHNAKKRKSGQTIYTTTEYQGKGDRYLLPRTAACLFGMASELGVLGYIVDFGDMSSENGSDPGKPGSHHSGHGHLGKRIGLDVDFRYVNSSKKSVRGEFTESWFNFDKNKKIFEVAKKYNFGKNYTTKTNSVDLTVVEGTRHSSHHDDHGHLGLNTSFSAIKIDTINVNKVE